MIADDRLEAASLDELHDEIDDAVRLLDAVDLNDVRVAEAGRHLRLALEALHHLLAPDELGEHRLDRHFAIQGDITRQIDGRHAASAQLTEDLILARGGFLNQRK